MKKMFAIAIGATLAVLSHGQGRAQVLYNSVDLNPSIQARTEGYLMTHRPGSRNMGKSEALIEIERLEGIGSARIKAGRATTTFVPSVAGTHKLAKNITWDAGAPQDLAGQTRLIQRYVKMFNMLAAQNGFAINDAADGYVFASALSYAAYHDKDENKAKIEQLRKDWRENLLAHTYFQGLPDDERQFDHEKNVFMAMQAVEQRAKARRAVNEAERKAFQEKAIHL